MKPVLFFALTAFALVLFPACDPLAELPDRVLAEGADPPDEIRIRTGQRLLVLRDPEIIDYFMRSLRNPRERPAGPGEFGGYSFQIFFVFPDLTIKTGIEFTKPTNTVDLRIGWDGGHVVSRDLIEPMPERFLPAWEFLWDREGGELIIE